MRRASQIVVTEDNPETREEIALALRGLGNEVVALADGEQLVAYLEGIVRDSRRPPDLITLDVYMPGSSGIEVLERLRDEGWGVPVVLLTSFATPGLRRRAEVAGAAEVIEKPFELSELRAAALLARLRPPFPNRTFE